MALTLAGKRIVVIGRPSGIAKAVVDAACVVGANVIVAGRNPEKLRDAYREGAADVHHVDLTDEDSIASLASEVGRVDHVVSTASARARGLLRDLDPAAIRLSLDTKVVGPLLLAKHFAERFYSNGSLTLFSGVAAFKPVVGYMGVAVTNGAADFLTRSLALELAPVRVNAISPGVIDTGAWDALGDQGKLDYFNHYRAVNPVRRIGTVADIAEAVLFAMTNEFMTGVTVRVDGGEPLT